MKRHLFIKTITLISFTLLLSFSNQAQIIESQIDDILNASYKANEPGATALVYKNGNVIYRKGFGSANLELGVAMKPEHVFEIGSITKQFTAIAILMLEEQGKLKVEDEITKYIPDYPTLGKTITIHQLLNHTSGIKSYTAMQSFRDNARRDMTPTEIIDFFKNEQMDFDPGEKFLYNNSGYILLGHIIEVVTGNSYADFIQKNIFDKLGMKNSYYGSMNKIINFCIVCISISIRHLSIISSYCSSRSRFRFCWSYKFSDIFNCIYSFKYTSQNWIYSHHFYYCIQNSFSLSCS